jgi:hypothetical protein
MFVLPLSQEVPTLERMNSVLRVRCITSLCAVLTAALGCDVSAATNPFYRWFLQRDILINADCWEAEPRIMAAGLGFTGILGVPFLNGPNGEQWCRAFGGTWNTYPQGEDPPLRSITSAASVFSIWIGYGPLAIGKGGFPVEFSWPVQPSTVSPTDFRITLNDGSIVYPVGASIFPNFEYNERSTVVLVGDFGNRLDPETHSGALYPVQLDVVQDDTPLTVVGPGGKMASAVGFSYGDGVTPMTAYLTSNGPRLCAAKLTIMDTRGEGGPSLFSGTLPNDGTALYGDDAQYRLRVLTTGGFSPDGVLAVLPTDFETFFRIRVDTKSGEEIWLTQTGVPYDIDGSIIEVVGLAELGLVADQDPWVQSTYSEDHDNQIDIVLKGDEAAMRQIRFVHIPAGDDYLPLYNPGGPGNNPTPGVVYSQPGPEDMQPVLMAIDHPLTVTWFGPLIR